MTTVSQLVFGQCSPSNIPKGFDLRPFLYPARFPWQFNKIDEIAGALPDRSHSADKAKVD